MRYSGSLLLCAIILWPMSLLAVDQKLLSERKAQLESMSSVERDRLDRNIQEYEKLSPSQKQHYRELHAKLSDDRTHGGRLSSLLQTYALWVQTLPPTQRDELQRETDISKKIVLVRRFKEEQEHPSDVHEPAQDDPLPEHSPKINPKVALDARDLQAVMRVVANNLSKEVMKPEFAEPLPGDYLTIIRLSANSSEGLRDWPGESLQLNMIAAISKEPQQMINRADSKRDMLVRLILVGIFKQTMQSIRFPTMQENMQTFQSLSPEERTRVMSLPPEKMTRFLVQTYFQSKGDESYKTVPRLKVQLEDLAQKLGVTLPPKLLRPGANPDRVKNDGTPKRVPPSKAPSEK